MSEQTYEYRVVCKGPYGDEWTLEVDPTWTQEERRVARDSHRGRNRDAHIERRSVGDWEVCDE